jgi:hypothetical protein
MRIDGLELAYGRVDPTIAPIPLPTQGLVFDARGEGYL